MDVSLLAHGSLSTCWRWDRGISVLSFLSSPWDYLLLGSKHVQVYYHSFTRHWFSRKPRLKDERTYPGRESLRPVPLRGWKARLRWWGVWLVVESPLLPFLNQRRAGTGVTVCREVAWDTGSLSLYVDETQLVGSRLGK